MENQTIGYAKYLGNSGQCWDEDCIYEVKAFTGSRETMIVSSKQGDIEGNTYMEVWKFVNTRKELEPKKAKDALLRFINPLNVTCICCETVDAILGCGKACNGDDCAEVLKKIIEEME